MSGWADLRDALDLTFRPVDRWPGKQRYDRERSPFSAPMKTRLATLKRELSMLRAANIVLQIAIRERDLRQDGLPRADARAQHPGVILAFDSRHGPLRVFHDGFTRWEDNLYAVALHLENLRHASLYGVGQDGQQYQGWRALPSGGSSNGFKSAEEAACFILVHSGRLRPDATEVRAVTDNPQNRAAAYRAAAAVLHPDRGGNHEQFVMLQQAKAMLDRVD